MVMVMTKDKLLEKLSEKILSISRKNPTLIAIDGVDGAGKTRVSSSLSEGMNNVIKTVKKRAYGYRNMAYFKLKILQVCGFLNTKWVPMNFQ
ncbi:MAG: hypothetical protein HON90_02965 [Halobacteriovoraceae bacterium]|nr:hypothetical protein [Halobacteriovoraceae bacterium]